MKIGDFFLIGLIALAFIAGVYPSPVDTREKTGRGAASEGPIPPPLAPRLVKLPAGNQDREALFAAIAMKENGGDENCCLGTYAITEAYWIDGTEFGQVDWDYETYVWSARHCKQVMEWYWQRYGATNDEQRARMHKGGPSGPWKDSSLQYWQDVKSLMEATCFLGQERH